MMKIYDEKLHTVAVPVSIRFQVKARANVEPRRRNGYLLRLVLHFKHSA